MRGPFERLKYELRRLWECPVCHKRERAPGSVTSRLCLCQIKQPDGRPVVMKLIEDGPQRVVPPVIIAHEPLPPLPPLQLEPPADSIVPAAEVPASESLPAPEPPIDAS